MIVQKNPALTYADLRRQVQEAGLLDRSGWKAVPIALVTIVIGAATVAILATVPGAWRLVAFPVLALFWLQIGFFGHDLGHNQVFPRTESNRRWGLFCMPFLLGISFRPWVIKHNLHHAETNIIDADPDISHPLLAFTEEAALERRGVLRWLVRYQAYAYPVLAFFTTAAFRVDAWRYAVGKSAPQKSDKYAGERHFELSLLALNFLLWFVVPSIILGPLTWLPIFVLGQMLLGFQLAFVFAPNHKGMPMFTEETRLGFLEQQVLTSRNVYGGPVVDFMYGGLNYQVEHHLFPTMPRQNFGACRDIVRKFCTDIDLLYTEESFVQSYYTLFNSLNSIGQLTRLAPVPVAIEN